MDPTPKSLILDLLGTVGRESAPVRSLVAAGALFGMAENSLRVALARLLAEGRIERDSRGSYRLGPASAAVASEIRGWRRASERLAPWSGDWVAVQTAGSSRASARRRRQRARALRFLGFRHFAPGLEIRPDNLAGGVEALRERLAELAGSPDLVFRISDLDPASERRAASLWDPAALVAEYRGTRARLAESAARLPELPREAAMVESWRIGGAAIRQLVLDPLLPEPIVPAAERDALAAEIRRYDALGRRAWAGWLDGAEPASTPAGVRGPRPAADVLERTEGGHP